MCKHACIAGVRFAELFHVFNGGGALALGWARNDEAAIRNFTRAIKC